MDTPKLIIDKLSQYSFITNILPGAILCIILKYLVGYDLFFTNDWVLIGIIFYFVGMVNNRVGSVIIMPILRWTRFIKLKPYAEYISAEKKDEKITTLSLESTAFRSYISVCFLSLLSMLFKTLSDRSEFINNNTSLILLLLLFILFLFSYRKQIRFVRDRIDNANKQV